MFDYVKCDYSLPLPEDISELSHPPSDWSEVEFQTKSLYNLLETYTIEEDGQIYKEEVDREFVSNERGVLTLDETVKGIIKVEHTGEIDFYQVFMEEEYDYWIEFKALIWKGELKEICLKDFKKECNSKRKEAEAKVQELLDEANKKQIKKEQPLRKLLTGFVKKTMILIRWVLNKKIQLTFKIERWLT